MDSEGNSTSQPSDSEVCSHLHDRCEDTAVLTSEHDVEDCDNSTSEDSAVELEEDHEHGDAEDSDNSTIEKSAVIPHEEHSALHSHECSCEDMEDCDDATVENAPDADDTAFHSHKLEEDHKHEVTEDCDDTTVEKSVVTPCEDCTVLCFHKLDEGNGDKHGVMGEFDDSMIDSPELEDNCRYKQTAPTEQCENEPTCGDESQSQEYDNLLTHKIDCDDCCDFEQDHSSDSLHKNSEQDDSCDATSREDNGLSDSLQPDTGMNCDGHTVARRPVEVILAPPVSSIVLPSSTSGVRTLPKTKPCKNSKIHSPLLVELAKLS